MSNLYVINGTELMGKCYSLKRNPRDKNPGEVIVWQKNKPPARQVEGVALASSKKPPVII